jgi:hypothetical protein
VLLIGSAVRLQTVLNPDVSWFLVAASRMLDGGSYARDFFEINMPWAIAAYIPPHFLVWLFGWSVAHALTAWTMLLAAQCTWLCVRLAPVQHGTQRSLWASWLLFAVIFLPLKDFGQREHLATMLFLPFLFQLARGTEGGPWLRSYVAALAAYGFYMKPHYAPLAALLLGVAALRNESLAVLRSAEARVILLAAFADVAVVVLLYPDWFICARWAQDAYAAYRSTRWQWVVLTPEVGLFVVMSAVCLARAWADRTYRAAAWPLLLTAGYSLLAYLLQYKGWSYQMLPALVAAFAALGLALFTRPPARAGAWLAATVATALFVVIQTVAAYRQMPRASNIADTNLATVAYALSSAEKNSYCYVFTTNMTPVFPTVVLMNLKWASRFPTLWPLPALANRGAGSEDNRSQVLTGWVAEDFRRYRPSVVLVDQRDDQFGLPRGFDILGVFVRDARFAEQWQDYQKVADIDGYAAYRRVSSPTP